MLLKSFVKPAAWGSGKISLRALLVFPFILQIFGAVGIVGYLSFRNGQKAVENLANQVMGETSARVEQHLESYLKQSFIVAQLNVQAAQRGELTFRNLLKSESYLWQQIQVFDSVYAIYLGSEEGQFSYVRRESDGQLIAKVVEAVPNREVYALNDRGQRIEHLDTEQYDPRLRPWYQEARRIQQPAWSPIYSYAGGELGMTVSNPWRDAEGKLRGVIAVDLTLDRIGDFLRDLKISPHSQVFILERSGLLVATSTPEDPFRLEPRAKQASRLAATESETPLTRATANYLSAYFDRGKMARWQSQQQLTFKWEGKRHFIQVQPFSDREDLDWAIVTVIPEDDFMGQIHANTRVTILLCGGALGGAIVLGWLTSRWLSKPIERVIEATQALANGELDKTVQVENIKELDVLARSFNRMAGQLKESFFDLGQANTELERRVAQRTEALQLEKEKSEQLLLNILPEAIADRLKNSQNAIAEHFDEVTILFADIVGFTALAERLKPIELVNLLNRIFSQFDALADYYGLEKIKTIGDAYMVASGLPFPREDHADAIAEMALAMQSAVSRFRLKSGETIQIRVGINTGVVVAGVIGTKKFIYDLWGDAVNVASRMESSGEPGSIQVTEDTYHYLKEKYRLEMRGAIAVKGKGDMTTYWLKGRRLGFEFAECTCHAASNAPPITQEILR